jgi:hypothetical protein
MSASLATAAISGFASMLSGNLIPGRYLPLARKPRNDVLNILLLGVDDIGQLLSIDDFLMYP